jgi:hypothetical protein
VLHIALPRIVGGMHVHGPRSTLENLVWLTHQPWGRVSVWGKPVTDG